MIEAVINRAKSDLHVNPLSDLQGIGELNSRKVKHCVQYRETDFNFLSRAPWKSTACSTTSRSRTGSTRWCST